MVKIPHLRWWIAGLLFLVSVLNYVDRQALSILVPTIQSDLGISDRQYGDIVSGFLAAYTIAYLFSGRIVDALGSRVSLAIFLAWWSCANMLTGLSRSAWSLGGCRFLLGLGEAGGYTASPKAVSEWFPAKDRGIAVGLYSVGGSVGATVAPVIVIGLAAQFGWRSAFVVTGAIGLLLAVIWLVVVSRPPVSHPWLTDGERALILAGNGREKSSPGLPVLSESTRWRSILSEPAVWALMGARLLTDPIWYFFQFWMPKYLHSERGLDQRQLVSMWMVFLAADLGFLASGFISAYFLRRGATAADARLRVMLGAAVLVPLASLVTVMPSLTGVFAIAMIVVFAHAAWLTAISTYVVDFVPQPLLGTAFGFIAAGSAVGGILMTQAVAATVAHFSYAPCFYAMIALHPIAFALVWRFARRPWAASADVRGNREDSSS